MYYHMNVPFQITIGMTLLIVIICFYHKNSTNTKETKYLDEIDCICWINLKSSTDRKYKMEEMFSDAIFSGNRFK